MAQHIVVVVVYKWQSHESSAKIDNLLVNKWPHHHIYKLAVVVVCIFICTKHTIPTTVFAKKGQRSRALMAPTCVSSFLFY